MNTMDESNMTDWNHLRCTTALARCSPSHYAYTLVTS